MRSPLTSIVFALELTHDLNVLPGLLFAAMAADALTVLLMRRSILTEKVARRGYHIYREYSVDPLRLAFVGDVMDSKVPTVPPEMKVSELCDRIAGGDPLLSPRQALPIVDAEGKLAGIITRGDLVHALGVGRGGHETVVEAGSTNLIVAHPDETVRDAVQRMLRNNVGRVLVVSREDKNRFLGYLGRSRVMETWLRAVTDETEREASRRPPLLFDRLKKAI